VRALTGVDRVSHDLAEALVFCGCLPAPQDRLADAAGLAMR
jgi:hypothetical protein